MKAGKLIGLLGLIIIIFQSCLPSLHPLYSKDTIVIDDAIVGVWVESDSDYENIKLSGQGHPSIIDSSRLTENGHPPVMKFEKNKDRSYLMTHYDEHGKVAYFETHLVKLGKQIFLDFYPTTDPSQKGFPNSLDNEKFNAFEAIHYYPVHVFARLDLREDTFQLSFFDMEYLGKLMEQNRIRIKHEETQEGVIFTAKTEDLQKFILKYGEDQKLYFEPTAMKKLL